MEQILLKFFSENGMVAGLFLLMLYGIYKLVMFLGSKAIYTYEQNLKLQREAQEKKDLEFLKSVGEISHVIKNGDDRHEEAHKKLGEKIESGHKEIIEKVGEVIKYQLKGK